MLPVIFSFFTLSVFLLTSFIAQLVQAEDSFELDKEVTSGIINSQWNYQFYPTTEISEHVLEDIAKAEKRKNVNYQVGKLQEYLLTKNSIFSDKILSQILVEESKKHNADYRIIVAVMGKESGYCAANYKLYNCFGYLNGVQYSSYEDAFRSIVPRVAQMSAPYGWNIRGFANAYRPVDKDGWALRITGMANLVP